MRLYDDFTILKNNPDMIYLDSAATSLTPNCVVDAMSDYYLNYRATVNRSYYKNGVLADNAYNRAREDIAKFINAKTSELIFVKSTTTGMNYIARNIIDMLSSNDNILTSELEHHSTLLPFREIGKTKDIKTKYIPVDKGLITYDNFVDSVDENTKVVVLHHVSNVLGDIVDIKKIAKYCRLHNIITVFDGAQAVSHLSVDVKDIDCDFYVFSGHKILGPTGIGVVYAKEELLNKMVFDYGGDMAHLVTLDDVSFKELPTRLEGGTPSIAEVIGLGAAIRYLNEFNMTEIHKHVEMLRNYAIKQLKNIDEVIIYNEDIKGSIITFNIKGMAAHDALSNLSIDHIAIRGGHMCNQLTLKYLDVFSVLRISFYIYNDTSDVDAIVHSIKMAIKDPMRWDMEIFS